MRSKATYLAGYEQHPGELELTDAALTFYVPKDRTGSFAAFGLIGVLLTDKFKPLVTIPRNEVLGIVAGHPGAITVNASRGPLQFMVENVPGWLAALPAAAPVYPCARCQVPLVWVAQYSRWFCHTCQQYA